MSPPHGAENPRAVRRQSSFASAAAPQLRSVFPRPATSRKSVRWQRARPRRSLSICARHPEERPLTPMSAESRFVLIASHEMHFDAEDVLVVENPLVAPPERTKRTAFT